MTCSPPSSSADGPSPSAVPCESGPVVESDGLTTQLEADDGANSSPRRVPFIRRFILLVLQPVTLLLFLTTLVVTRGMGQGEFFFYNDEMYHAMTEVFFRDALVDLPLRHPLQYAYEYAAT